MRMSKIRHQYAILTPSWLVPPALLTFKRHSPVTKADVVLTFCTYKVLYTKKAGGKTCRGNRGTCARISTSKVPKGYNNRQADWLLVVCDLVLGVGSGWLVLLILIRSPVGLYLYPSTSVWNNWCHRMTFCDVCLRQYCELMKRRAIRFRLYCIRQVSYSTISLQPHVPRSMSQNSH